MAKIVGVRFQTAGKIYYFDPKDYKVSRGTHVIVETARGTEYGTVIFGPKEVPEEEVVSPLKEVIRVATSLDDDREMNNRFKEREAFLICKQKIRNHGLEMKLIKAEYTFDNNKLLFYFTADGRVDFRELVKDLASQFHTRIELRQIGVRDETKLLGGLGICGRELCCHTFLSDFAPVSIKMAKEQNLSLNPAKISGTCGRLMCCLNNEAETYQYLNSKMPKNGAKVFTPEGIPGVVRNVNVLRQSVKVVIENGEEREIREYAVSDLLDENGARQAVKEAEQAKSERRLISTASSRTGAENGSDGEERKAERPERAEKKRASSAGEQKKKKSGSKNQSKKKQSGNREGAETGSASEKKLSRAADAMDKWAEYEEYATREPMKGKKDNRRRSSKSSGNRKKGSGSKNPKSSKPQGSGKQNSGNATSGKDRKGAEKGRSHHTNRQHTRKKSDES